MNQEVELFIPCVVDQFYPATAFNTIKLLEKAGCSVTYNPEQTCCGKVSYDAGYWKETEKIAGKFLNDFTSDSYIVAPSASCVGMIKKGYNDLFTNSSVHNKCRAIQRQVYEISDFLVNILKFENFGAELIGTAVYMDSCSALRNCNIKDEPRRLLSNVGGLVLIDNIEGQDVCCGFGGSFSIKFEGISAAMAEQKVKNAQNVHADYIISGDSSCLLHIESYIHKNNIPIKPMHLVDVLAFGWANI